MKCCRILGLCLLLTTTAQGQSDTEPVPDLNSRMADGFLVKCYWIGTYRCVEKFEGQGVTDLFGQALSPVCGKQTTTASIIITEEIDNSGQRRAVVRGGNWASNFTGLHYSFKNGRRVGAGPGGSGGGRIPNSGEGAPNVSLTYDKNTAGISLGWTESEPLAFDSRYLPLKLVTGGPSPLGVGPAGRQHVELDTKEKTERRKAHIMGMMVTEEPVQPGRHTVIRQEWGDPGSDWYAQWTMTRACEYGQVKLVTPHGNPRTAPRDGQNEFTFDGNSPGKLVINFKASVTPASAINSLRGRVSFTCEGIGGSTFAWDANNSGGKAIISGGYLVAKGTFTGLPEKNKDFGKKRVQLLLEGDLVEATDIEVFFKRDEKNHPGGQANTPNWFHYWSQLMPGHKVKYGGAGHGPAAEVKAGTEWNYATARDKKEITVYDATKGKYKSYGVGEEFSGIDRLIGTIKHEAKHVDQIARADPLVPSSGSDTFRFGWSWNVQPHNHWNKGADGKWGRANVDDDGNGKTDDANMTPSFEPGGGDDNNLGSQGGSLWPSAWALPVPNNAPHPIESEAVNYSDKNHAEHQNARDDWSNPGKNHHTLNRYDD